MIHACGGGSIINLSSVVGFLATPYATAYGASKAAVRQLTKSVAQYWAERSLKIRCNSVHPGDVRTPLWDQQASETARKRGLPLESLINQWQKYTPLGDFVQPKDVAAAVLFVVSDESRYMTGAKLVVDGGFVYCDTYRAKKASATRCSQILSGV